MERSETSSYCSEERLKAQLNIRTSLLAFNEETNRRIETVIVKTVLDLVPATRVPIENISLELRNDEDNSDCSAKFQPGRNLNGGTIIFYKSFLIDIGQRMTTDLNKVKEDALGELVSTTAHEMYHVREAKRFPKVFWRMALQSGDWYEHRDELAATLFALKYWQSRSKEFQNEHEIEELLYIKSYFLISLHT